MKEQSLNKVACGERIRNLRLENQLSQSEFSNLLHTTQSNLCKIEKGISAPSLDVLYEIRRNFNVSIDYILYGTCLFSEPTSSKLKKIHSLVVKMEKELTIMNTNHGI